MTRFEASIAWARGADEAFSDQRYSRGHVWRFDGGAEVAASSSPHSVKLPYSVAENVDPEEAFVAAVSSCHMLFYLFHAARKGLVIDRYEDAAEGFMEKDPRGRMAMTRIVLHPRVAYGGEAPDRASEEALHHRSHEDCYIANSVLTAITIDLG